MGAALRAGTLGIVDGDHICLAGLQHRSGHASPHLGGRRGELTTLRLRWLLVGIGVHVHVGVGATPEFERITFRVLTVAVVPTIAVRTITIAEVIAVIRCNVRLRDARNHVATAIARIRHLDRRPVRAGLWLIMQVVLFPIDRGLLEVHVDGGVIPHCDGDGSGRTGGGLRRDGGRASLQTRNRGCGYWDRP